MNTFKEALVLILHNEEDGTELIDTVNLIMGELEWRLPQKRPKTKEYFPTDNGYNSALAEIREALGIGGSYE